jgi:uncharacterized protein
MVDEYFKAIKEGEASKVEQMVERNAELVNARNESGMSAVVVATYYGQQKIAGYLISRGANLNFFEASMSGKVGVVKKLVEENPAIVNSYSSDGFTAIHLASFFGSKEIAQFLIQNGADVNAVAKNLMKVMPLHSAVARSHFEIAELLVSNGAEVNAVQDGGIAPLHEAAQNGNLEIAKLLLKNGADVNARASDGRTALVFTQTEGREAGPKEMREKVAELLRQHGGK